MYRPAGMGQPQRFAPETLEIGIYGFIPTRRPGEPNGPAGTVYDPWRKGRPGAKGRRRVEGTGGSWEEAEETYRAIGRAPGREGTAAGGYRGSGDDGGSRLLRGAILYARRGIPVFPCEPGGKRPLTANGFWEATTDERELARWWRRWPRANVAIPTGRSSGLLVLDVDAGEGLQSVAELELSRGQPPKTAKASTGGGGEHLYFRYPTQRELRAAGLYWEKVRNSQGLLGEGLDVRGEGGYVVAPPSRTLRAYEWSDSSPPASPSWLLGCLRAAETGEALF